MMLYWFIGMKSSTAATRRLEGEKWKIVQA
jgi:hypothetical protein